jgi:hypothetical protein
MKQNVANIGGGQTYHARAATMWTMRKWSTRRSVPH